MATEPLLLAATVSLLALGLLSVYLASRQPTPSPEPTVSPTPSATSAFHDLLTDFRPDEVVLDRSEGQPDERISNDRTVKTVDLGSISLPWSVRCRDDLSRAGRAVR